MLHDYEEILRVIKENFKNINTIAELSEILNLPHETLRKTFTRSSENGIGTTIDLLKIEEMKRLLIITDMKCLSICIQVGLREDSGSHFFRRHTGITMSEFRMRHRTRGGAVCCNDKECICISLIGTSKESGTRSSDKQV